MPCLGDGLRLPGCAGSRILVLKRLIVKSSFVTKTD